MSFYNSREWKQLRFKALLIHGRKCLCCNAVDKPLHVDHIKPISKYPELRLELDNLQVLCEDCNLGKSNLFETDFRAKEKVEIVVVPPVAYCWAKFNSGILHRWTGFDTICKAVSKGNIILSENKASYMQSPKGKICQDCKKLVFKSKRKKEHVNLKPKTKLKKKVCL